jgi:hypothetical protein
MRFLSLGTGRVKKSDEELPDLFLSPLATRAQLVKTAKAVPVKKATPELEKKKSRWQENSMDANQIAAAINNGK